MTCFLVNLDKKIAVLYFKKISPRENVIKTNRDFSKFEFHKTNLLRSIRLRICDREAIR